MKIRLMCLLLMLLSTLSYGQIVHSIRFVHGGDEDIPIGTLVISVEKLIKPKDRGELDKEVGKSIKTDMRTFNIIKQFTETNQDVSKVLKKDRQYYEVIVNDKTKLYLHENTMVHYFNNLRVLLKKERCDNNVLTEINGYPL